MRIVTIIFIILLASMSTSQMPLKNDDSVEYSIYKLNTKLDEAISIINSVPVDSNGVRNIQEKKENLRYWEGRYEC